MKFSAIIYFSKLPLSTVYGAILKIDLGPKITHQKPQKWSNFGARQKIVNALYEDKNAGPSENSTQKTSTSIPH